MQRKASATVSLPWLGRLAQPALWPFGQVVLDDEGLLVRMRGTGSGTDKGSALFNAEWSSPWADVTSAQLASFSAVLYDQAGRGCRVGAGPRIVRAIGLQLDRSGVDVRRVGTTAHHLMWL